MVRKFCKTRYAKQLSDELRLIETPFNMNKIYLHSLQADQDSSTSPSPLPTRSDNLRSGRRSCITAPSFDINDRNTRLRNRHTNPLTNKVRRLRNGLVPLLPKPSLSRPYHCRPGGGRGAHNRTISPILSRGSLSSCSEGGQASSISWEGTPASEPEFKVRPLLTYVYCVLSLLDLMMTLEYHLHAMWQFLSFEKQ